MANGPIFALDLGTRLGWAFGSPGERPARGSVRLKNPDDDKSIAFFHLTKFLFDKWSKEKPALVVKESMLHLGAFLKMGNGQDVVRMTAGYHAIVEGMCACFLVQYRDVADSTVRKHFIGRGNMGSRDATKAAVLRRCRLLKLMDESDHDDNCADAIAIHDWACATLGGRSLTTDTLYLYGER